MHSIGKSPYAAFHERQRSDADVFFHGIPGLFSVQFVPTASGAMPDVADSIRHHCGRCR